MLVKLYLRFRSERRSTGLLIVWVIWRSQQYCSMFTCRKSRMKLTGIECQWLTEPKLGGDGSCERRHLKFTSGSQKWTETLDYSTPKLGILFCRKQHEGQPTSVPVRRIPFFVNSLLSGSFLYQNLFSFSTDKDRRTDSRIRRKNTAQPRWESNPRSCDF